MGRLHISPISVRIFDSSLKTERRLNELCRPLPSVENIPATLRKTVRGHFASLAVKRRRSRHKDMAKYHVQGHGLKAGEA